VKSLMHVWTSLSAALAVAMPGATALPQGVTTWGPGACRVAAGGARTVTRDSGSIRIVENHLGRGRLPHLQLDSGPDRILGPAGNTRLAAFTALIFGALLPDRSILVADGVFRTEVRMYDSSNVLRRFVSRLGDGPEEYRQISAIHRGPADTTVLVDGPRRRLLYIDLDGRVARTLVLPDFSVQRVAPDSNRRGSTGRVSVVGVLRDGAILGKAPLPIARVTGGLRILRDTAQVYVLSLGATAWKRLDVLVPGRTTFFYSAEEGSLQGAYPFGSIDAFVADHSGYYHGAGHLFEIRHIDAFRGTVDRIVRLCIPTSRVSSSDIRGYRDSVLAAATTQTGRLLREKLLSQLTYPSHRQAHGYLNVDKSGRLWVKSNSPLTPNEFYGFLPTGELIATATIPRGTLEMDGEYALVARLDALNVPSLYLHRWRTLLR
jgi:hypothetical protein